jgi:hypothetical protein
MRRQLRSACLIAWLVLGHGAGAGAQDAVTPGPENPAGSRLPREGAAAATSRESSPSPLHEALQPTGTRRDPEYIGKAPPAMITERPGALGPGPDARWIEGYWDWDRDRGEFAWVTGTWLVPPPGEFWVNGYWRRHAKGWYRVPGFWSGGGQVGKDRRVHEVTLDVRRTGTPLTRPEEPIGIAPGPDYFYIPGEYIPAGGGVLWRQGFWARSQPGWEWIPARWDRRADAWVFREGFWNRAPGTSNLPPGGLPPATGTTLISKPAGIGPPLVRMGPSPGAPGNVATARGEADQTEKAADSSRQGQDAGRTTQAGAPPKPGDPKPGPQPGPPQQPPSVWYGPRPAPPPGRAARGNARSPAGGRPARGNARSAVGGFLRRILP